MSHVIRLRFIFGQFTAQVFRQVGKQWVEEKRMWRRNEEHRKERGEEVISGLRFGLSGLNRTVLITGRDAGK